MPVEIKELIIRAKVIDDSQESSEKGERIDPQEKSEIISTCTAQVLKILARQRER